MQSGFLNSLELPHFHTMIIIMFLMDLVIAEKPCLTGGVYLKLYVCFLMHAVVHF